jgi:RHS repeat-associated protein
MTYDEQDRLISVNAPDLFGWTEFTYDLLGNLTSKWGRNGLMELTYDPVTNRLVRSTGPGVNLVSLTWDSPGRPATSSGGASYVYDPFGRRVAKTDVAGTTVYHHDAAGRVIAETTAEGVKLRDYVYLGNKLVAVDGCISTALPSACTERNWYHTDALGSVLARTDQSGTVVAAFDYQAWGERWHAPGLVVGTDGDRQYNGRVYDAGTGFHDYGARLYWPEIGRFISADSYLGDPANPASLNRYSYVHNNPYKYIDPTGHAAACGDGLGIGCGSGGGGGASGSAGGGGGGGAGGGFRPPAAADPAAAEAAAAQEAAALQAAARAPAQRLLPQRAGPTGQISPSEVAGRTPQEIDARARQLGLEPKGPNPQGGRGSYVDPQTGKQRVLVHPEGEPPHGHVNNPAGERVGPNGTVVPQESPEAHLPIKMVPSH